MILRHTPEGRLLCFHQTTHAWHAAQFCRHWGNPEFVSPLPNAAVIPVVTADES